MDQNQFDAMSRILTRIPSRRDVLRSLAGAGLGVATLGLPGIVEAEKKKKRKKKRKQQNPPVDTPTPGVPPLVFNQYGCIDVGQPCRGDSNNCCSGICQGTAPAAGQPDASRCVAHNISICKASADICSTGNPGYCNVSKLTCQCRTTTGNAGFCGDFSSASTAACRVCTRDTDCEAEFGPGAACLVHGGICAESCAATGGTICARACAA